MTITAIGIFCVGALAYGWLLPASWRRWALLVASVLSIYWLQPQLAIRTLDFALPTLTLVIASCGWWLTRPDQTFTTQDRLTLGVMVAVVLCISGLGMLGVGTLITPSNPPALGLTAIGLISVAAILFACRVVITDRSAVIPLAIIAVIVLFIVLKWEPLTVALVTALRLQQGQLLSLATPADIGWMGFSYVAFRLLHTLRERQMGKLPAMTLREYVTYVIFFPAITAGPIDRAERFIKDLHALESYRLDAVRLLDAGSRIVSGLFKKFVVAYALTFIALNATNATQIHSQGAAWLLTYAYAFLLFFDFSGYSDVAIGLGRLFGVNLPENFNAPYLKPNLTTFWQSWHMTLSSWARLYVFTPASRLLMSRENRLPPMVEVLLTQLLTMTVIGLWHGFTLNFVIWGLWHGVGLWIHRAYTDRTRMFYQSIKDKPAQIRFFNWLGIVVTFHFVALSWVWFALPTVELSLRVFRLLFGIGA